MDEGKCFPEGDALFPRFTSITVTSMPRHPGDAETIESAPWLNSSAFFVGQWSATELP